MVTDSLVKKKFVHETLQEGILKIYSTQENVVRNNFQRRTGRLLTTLSAHSFDSQISGENRTIFVRILPYLRFLDMQYRQRNDRISKFKRRNLALYNRVVWGVLYHETFPKLRYGFNDEVRNSIRQELENHSTHKIISYGKQTFNGRPGFADSKCGVIEGSAGNQETGE